MVVSPLTGILLSFLLVASAYGADSCFSLVERVVPSSSSFKLSLKAGAQSSRSLEGRSGVFGGVYFELPLVDPEARKKLRQQRKEREAVLKAIAAYKNALVMLAYKKEVLRYHRLRVKMGLEENDQLLKAKEEVLTLEGKIRLYQATLLAYGIAPEEAASCRW